MRARVFDPNKNTAMKRFKKKALLIGVKQIRSTDTGETTRGEKKKSKMKVDNSRPLRGPHHDIQAMKRLLIGALLRFTFVSSINHDPLQISTAMTPKTSQHLSTMMIRTKLNRPEKI